MSLQPPPPRYTYSVPRPRRVPQGVSRRRDGRKKRQSKPYTRAQHLFLETLYTDPASPLAFTGLKTFSRAVERLHGIPVSVTQAWLKGQRVYSKQRVAAKRPKYRSDPTYVTGINEMWQADLVDMSQHEKENDGVRFLLTVVDALSRYAYVRPLRRKTPQEVKTAFESIEKEAQTLPVTLQTDHGKEFYNKLMTAWFQSKGIRHYSTYSDKKAAMVERFNQTLKQTIVDFWIHNRHTVYLERLQDFVKAYNARPHRTIKMPPQEVTLWNQHQVFDTVYGKYIKGEFPQEGPQFQVGDYVRLSIVKANIFQKSYYGRWTEAIYRVHRIITTTGNPRYEVAELDGTPIKGRFYADELQKIHYDPQQEFTIAAILDRRQRRVGRKTISEVLVQWRGYPEKYNSWEPETNLQQHDSLKKNGR